MTSLSSRLEPIGQALAEITDNCYHYWRSAPKGTKAYIVWAEDDEAESLNANNRKEEQGIHGTVDYFTMIEFDPVCDEIQEKLNNLENVSFRINSVQYEDDTTFIHYEWEFWVR